VSPTDAYTRAATTVTASRTATIQSALLEKFSSNIKASWRQGKRLYLRPDRAGKRQLTPEIGAIRA
jgi:hypothetical protein